MSIPAVGEMSLRITLATIRGVVALGADRAALISALSVDVGALPEDAFVPIQQHFAVWASAMRQLRRPELPILAGARRQAEDLHVRGFAVATSLTGLQACRRALDYTALTTNSAEWQLNEARDDGFAEIRFVREGERTLGHRVSNECAIASCVSMLRSLFGDDFCPSVVSFRHSAPSDIGEHARFFGGALHFDAVHDGLVLSSAHLREVPATANKGMRDYFDGEAEKRLQQLDRDAQPLIQRLRLAIEEDLGAGPSKMADIAKKLGMSARTLRRVLAAEGIGFSDLVVEVRLRLAEQWLKEGRLSLNEIALRLGFGEHSSFSRFFKHHRGRPPSALRQ